jgi:epoxyqueuosine reductase
VTDSAPALLAARAKAIALALGFDRAGVARLEPTAESRAFADWIARGRHAEMAWLARNVEKRVDPRNLFEGARSALVVALVYDQANAPDEAPAPLAPGQPATAEGPASADASGVGARSEPQANEVDKARATPRSGCVRSDSTSGRTPPGPATARIAKYARGTDYHDILLPRLRAVGTALEALAQRPTRWRAWVDTGPVLERVLALHAGVGWIGKNTCVIDPALGSFLFLGVLATDLELAPDAREPDHCGTCRACLDACPTGAFAAPYELDAARCLSYTTIELRGAIPEPLRAAHGEWVFGCDVCQDVCPWNRRTRRDVPPDAAGLRAALAPRAEWAAPTLAWLLSLDVGAWRASTRRSALRRAKHRGLLRNAIVAAGASGDRALVGALERHAGGPDELLAEHARWAIAQLGEGGSE